MVNKIVAGIANKLYSVYPSSEIYQNDISQGLTPPAFFINVVSSSVRPLSNSRHYMECILDVMYFPEEEGDNAAMHQIGGDLLDHMEMIELADGTMLRGTGKSFSITDSVLHFLVSYNQTLTKERGSDPKMATQTTNISVKG